MVSKKDRLVISQFLSIVSDLILKLNVCLLKVSPPNVYIKVISISPKNTSFMKISNSNNFEKGLVMRFIPLVCMLLEIYICTFLFQVNGILLDEEHNNDNEFTVVDCTKIKSGIIDFVKVGTVPKKQVTLQVWLRGEDGHGELKLARK